MGTWSLLFRLAEQTLAPFWPSNQSPANFQACLETWGGPEIPPNKYFGQGSPVLDDDIKSMGAGHIMAAGFSASKQPQTHLDYMVIY